MEKKKAVLLSTLYFLYLYKNLLILPILLSYQFFTKSSDTCTSASAGLSTVITVPSAGLAQEEVPWDAVAIGAKAYLAAGGENREAGAVIGEGEGGKIVGHAVIERGLRGKGVSAGRGGVAEDKGRVVVAESRVEGRACAESLQGRTYGRLVNLG